MNLPVPGLNVFHPDSQEMLNRPELSNTLRENVHWPCRNSPAFYMFKTPQRLQWPAWYWHDMGGPAGVQEHHFHVNSKILTSLPRRVVHGNSCSTSVAYHIIHQGGTKSLRCAVSSWLSSYWLRHGPVQHLWEKLRKTQTMFYSFNWIKARQPVQTGVVSWLFQHFVKGQWPAIRPTSFNKYVS